jgi:hypothetical protein
MLLTLVSWPLFDRMSGVLTTKLTTYQLDVLGRLWTMSGFQPWI